MDAEEKAFPILAAPHRETKPRHKGLTIVSDCGLPMRATVDILEVAGDIIDWAKFTDHAGTIGRYPASRVKAKAAIYRECGIPALVGGAVFELAYLQGKAVEYIERLPELGMAATEISEDLIPPLPPDVRADLIQRSLDLGLQVFTEFGRKFPEQPLDVPAAVEEIRADLKRGVRKVVIEEAEVLLIKNRGEDPAVLRELVSTVGIESVVFEARTPDVQIWLLQTIGPEVNLENMDLSGHQPVVTLERMRTGLHRSVGYGFIASPPPGGQRREWEVI